MITPGGEVSFVCAMVRECVASCSGREQGTEGHESEQHEDERERLPKRRRLDSYSPSTKFDTTHQLKADSKINSKNKRNRSRWYTSMLGKLSSVVDVVDLIKSLEVCPHPLSYFQANNTLHYDRSRTMQSQSSCKAKPGGGR